MSVWHGPQYRGAMADHRQRKRAVATARQQEWRERDRRRAQCRDRKKRYATRAGAAMALLDCRIRRVIRRQERRQEQRTYYCRPCGAWHLTSREDRAVMAS